MHHPSCAKYRSFAVLLAVLTLLPITSGSSEQRVDRCLVPAPVRDPILHELSGELARLHVQMLAANRDRHADEYLDTFFETRYLAEMAERYGLADVKVDLFPSGEIWDAEEAELWLVEPVRKKLASLTMVPAALASGSTTGEVEAEVVYVGAGRESDYAGKDLKGKIALGSGSVSGVFATAVNKHGAAGALGTGSAGFSADSAGYTLDQIGWQSVNPAGGPGGFGFVLSLRQFYELRSYVERGARIVVRAKVRTRTYPYRMNVVSASIPGRDPEAGELIYVAHAFERIGTPGANDNCTGVATILEIGRTLALLIRDGELPQPRRTIRFLWVPEISGSRAFMYKYADLQDKLIAALNFDMSGADLETTDSYLRMKMTPDSRPSFLNDLVGNLLQFVDQTEIRTQTGNNSPFNYRLVPYIGASDHIVFLDAGIPAMQFNHWPDNFYHSSADTIEHVDPTQLKRVGFMGAAAFYYLANAGGREARDLAWEAAANGEKWLSEVTRQSLRLIAADRDNVHERHDAAQNKVTGAWNRARGGVESVLALSGNEEVRTTVERLVANLDAVRNIQSRKLEQEYLETCRALGVKAHKVESSAQEKKYATMVPRKLFSFYTDEYRERNARVSEHYPKGAPRLTGLAASEVPASIDGNRSILDIYNLVRAQYGNVTTNSNERKFAYVVTPETSDIDIEAVAAQIHAMEKAGLVEIRTTDASAAARRK
jgi:aminopeptidase YwaD